ncbi:MAG: hypothetical protein JW941_10475 [Candidatus Coatesbacteria bacterium]|nr:hypothetical protein [Candidatus Coatesbacteria bacterium]
MGRLNLSIIGICLILLCVLATVIETTAGDKDVGVEWINNFAGTVNDRSHWDESAEGLYNNMTAEGWIGRFCFSNSAAWESDFTTNNGSYIDAVDLSLIGTHGSYGYDSGWGKDLSRVMFSTGSSDSYMYSSECYQRWGNGDAEWIALDCCSVLRNGNDSYKYWSRTMDGLHLLCGFKNTMYVNAPGDGKKWGDYMIDDGWFDSAETVTQAWFHAADYVQPNGVDARVLAEESENYDDYCWGEGSVTDDPVYDSDFYVWTHSTGCPPPRLVDTDIDKMMVFKFAGEKVDQQVATDMAKKFGLNEETQLGKDGFYRSNSEGKKFRVHENGGWFYGDMNQLWVFPKDAVELPSEDAAIAAAEDFFEKAGLMPADAGDPDVHTEIVSLADREKEDEDIILQEFEVMRCVFFPRELSYGGQTFTVMGPGAKLRAYIGHNGQLIGAHGGWRAVEESEEVEIFPEQLARTIVKDFGSKVALLGPPMFSTFELQDLTLCYFEYQTDRSGESLIPAYHMRGQFYQDGEAFDEGDMYIPASVKFMPPVPKIVRPQDGASFRNGQQIVLAGELNFGSGDVKLEWWSDKDGYLGSGITVSTILTSNSKQGEPMPQAIKLVATDSQGRSASDQVTVMVTRPWIRIELNEFSYQDGDDLTLLLSAGSPGAEIDVDLYMLMIGPGGQLAFFPQWNSRFAPLPFKLSTDFMLRDLKILSDTLPMTAPPIGRAGDYAFWAVIVNQHTGDVFGTASVAKFEYGLSEGED